jgi:hypothetical protein
MKKFILLILALFAAPAAAQPVSTPPIVALSCAFNTVPPAPVNGQFYFVQCDSSGRIITTPATPGGSTTQLQYNNAGAFGGISGWTTNGTTALTGGASTTLAVGSTITVGVGATNAPSITFTGATTTGLWTTGGSVNVTSPNGGGNSIAEFYSGTNRRAYFTGGSALYLQNGGSAFGIGPSGNGYLTLYPSSGSEARIQLGGTSSSFPMVKRNATAINFRLADDSADAAITAASITVGGGSAVSALASGTWTPTLTNTLNVDASTAYLCQYMRVGAVVTGSCRIDIDPTAGSTATALDFTPPVASNFGGLFDAAGTCNAIDGVSLSAGVLSDATGDTLRVQYVNTADTANRAFYCSFTYRVI